MELKEKLLQMQLTLKVPKNQYNSFGKYNFRNCEDILEAVKPICADYRVVLYLTDDIINIGAFNYIKATANLIDIDSDNVIVVTSSARESIDKKGMDDSQITGATSSYARKYALNAMFALDDAKDADTTNTHGKDDRESNKPEDSMHGYTPPKSEADMPPFMIQSMPCETEGCTNVVTATKTKSFDEVVADSQKYYKGAFCYVCRDKKYKEAMERKAAAGR